MPSDTTRLSVEIPTKMHKKLKILAEANGMTLKTLIIFALNPIIYPSTKRPNQGTLRAMEDADEGIGLKTYENIDHLWDSLGLNE